MYCFTCRKCLLDAVNGLEVGQAVVIAATVLVNNAIQLWRWPDGPLHDNNLFSLYLVLPFFGCSLALLKHNWYPSKIFVGDVRPRMHAASKVDSLISTRSVLSVLESRRTATLQE